jgi:hypothetical protein
VAEDDLPPRGRTLGVKRWPEENVNGSAARAGGRPWLGKSGRSLGIQITTVSGIGRPQKMLCLGFSPRTTCRYTKKLAETPGKFRRKLRR